jgi:hypothetical protein
MYTTKRQAQLLSPYCRITMPQEHWYAELNDKVFCMNTWSCPRLRLARRNEICSPVTHSFSVKGRKWVLVAVAKRKAPQVFPC